MNKIWFTSDTHLNHAKILEYCPNRQFETVQEHDEYLIKTWNSKIGQNDTVFHLGDFSFGTVEYSVNILSRLNGKKVLIAGNHDARHLNKVMFCDGWRVIHNSYFELRTTYEGENVYIIMCHYPLETWNKQRYGTIHLHGHCHSPPDKIKPSYIPNRFDVGVDGRVDHAPWEKNELISFIRTRGENV